MDEAKLINVDQVRTSSKSIFYTMWHLNYFLCLLSDLERLFFLNVSDFF